METINLFGPQIFKFKVNNREKVKELYHKKLQRLHWRRKYVPQKWLCDVNTSFGKKLPTHINWSPLEQEYMRITKDFLMGYPVQCHGFMIKDMWYNIYDKGQYQERHSHQAQKTNFSAIHFLKFDQTQHPFTRFHNYHPYYASMKSKETLFSLQSSGQNTFYSDLYNVGVEEGDLIIFPSELEHSVPRNESNELRMTIAFNIQIFTEPETK